MVFQLHVLGHLPLSICLIFLNVWIGSLLKGIDIRSSPPFFVLKFMGSFFSILYQHCVLSVSSKSYNSILRVLFHILYFVFLRLSETLVFFSFHNSSVDCQFILLVQFFLLISKVFLYIISILILCYICHRYCFLLVSSSNIVETIVC